MSLTETNLRQKDHIAGAFEKYFRHYGFKKTTVDEVAAELGISKKTIYKYFRSKDDIFYYIISRKAEKRRKLIEKEIEPLFSATEMMEAMIRINFSEFRKIHKKRVPGFDERYQSEIAGAAFRETFDRMLKDIIRKGVDQHEFEVADIDLTVRFIQSLIFEAVKVIREDHTKEPEDALSNTIIKILQKKP